MPEKTQKLERNVLQNMALFAFFAILFCNTLLPSANALDPLLPSTPLQSISTTVIPLQPQSPQGPQQQEPQQQQEPLQVPQVPQPQQPQLQPQPQQPQPQQPQQQEPLQVPQQNQQGVSPTESPQISWDALEEAESFIANGKMDSTLYTINGNWKSTGDWSMNVADGELTNFTATMVWNNGTAAHSHEFLNFEAADPVDISAEDQTISVAGTMDVGTNNAVSWEDVPSEIVVEGGKIISVSVDNEATDEHFSGQSVHGNVTSLSVCSTTPGPAMQVPSGC